jgi:hypothetical protein
MGRRSGQRQAGASGGNNKRLGEAAELHCEPRK